MLRCPECKGRRQPGYPVCRWCRLPATLLDRPAAALAGILRRRRVTRAELSRQAGVSRPTISELLSGRSHPGATIALLAQGLGLQPCGCCQQLGWVEPETTN